MAAFWERTRSYFFIYFSVSFTLTKYIIGKPNISSFTYFKPFCSICNISLEVYQLVSKVLPVVLTDILCCEPHGIPCGDWLILLAFFSNGCRLRCKQSWSAYSKCCNPLLIQSNSLPDDLWNPNVGKVTYYVLNELFDYIERKLYCCC